MRAASDRASCSSRFATSSDVRRIPVLAALLFTVVRAGAQPAPHPGTAEPVFWTDDAEQAVTGPAAAQSSQAAVFPDLTYRQAQTRAAAMAAVLEKTTGRIEQIRMGAATIEVRGADGSPAPGAALEIRQTSHDFKFGNYIRPRHYRNERFLSHFQQLFNYIQLLEFNWGQYELDEGRPLLHDRLHFLRKWAIPNGYRSYYGHMLVWTPDDDRDLPPPVPAWLFRYDKETQYRLLKERIQREVKDYRQYDMLWDVVNEAIHCRVWGDWDKPGWVQNRAPEPMDRIFPYVRDALAWAHAANPNARLLINDYAVIPKGRFQDRYKELIDRLLASGAPLHAIGIQGHEPFKGAYWNSPEELWSAYDLFGARTGLPIYITELWQVSDETREIRGTYRTGNWNQLNQADAIEEFYRVSFAHPSVEGIIYFGLADDDVEEPAAGLLDASYRPKLAWNRLKTLLWDEWTTKDRGQTTVAGVFEMRGFYGEYEVTVTAKGKRRRFQTRLEKGKPNRWVLTVEG
jgi:endo-1,4-beta-xylanase